jgi:hypothetical protein
LVDDSRSGNEITLKPPIYVVTGDYDAITLRLARGFKPPAFSRFLFQSAVKSAESF